MHRKTIALFIIAFAILSVCLLYLSIPRIIISLLANSHDLSIKYDSARFTPHFNTKNAGDFSVGIDMKNVLIKKKGGSAGTFDDLSSLVSAPFGGSWKYREIKGVVRPRRGKLLIDSLNADAAVIKVSAKGIYFYSKSTTDLDINILFSPDLLKKIPSELSRAILKPDENGWSGLSVSLKGDFKAPSIQITGRLFRLNIREISGS